MSFFLILLLFVSVVLLLAACVYPFSILAVLLQFVFMLLAFYVYSAKKRKGKKSLRTLLASLLHSVFFLFTILAFIYISLPSSEEGDIDSVTKGVKKFLSSKFGFSIEESNEDTKQENPTKDSPLIIKQPTDDEKPTRDAVKDPF
ncbi:MAG: hypothetical protein OEZ13_03010 [Spirochaetia bacterium]|nr:hypothetical protein [Spirochaetia bacterium]